MTEQLHDALRHLEKDMADIMEVLQDKNTTEVILNPYRKSNGNYVGYVLVDQHGKGLHNLIKYTKSNIESPPLAKGDRIVYKASVANPDNILFWIKLTGNLEDDLRKVSLCLKSYFDVTTIRQSTDFKLLEFAERIEDGELFDSPMIWDGSVEFLVDWINNQLPKTSTYQLRYITITEATLCSGFISYPGELIKSELVKLSMTKAETIMSVLASITGKFIHHKIPFLECQIPRHGHRFTGVIPPVVPFPAFCIRKHVAQVFTLTDFVKQGILQESSRETILNWIRRKFNILIAGGTGSGKTTLANTILYEIAQLFPDTRVLIIEDVPELKFHTARSVSFTVGEFFSMYDALRATLRFKPDRIVMGEVRGAEAYTLLKAWNTGHPGGVATIHANGVKEALYRFESCIRDHPLVNINRQEIGFTINGIISIQNITFKEEVSGEFTNVVKRKVTALRQILQYDPDKDIYQDIIYDQEHFSE